MKNIAAFIAILVPQVTWATSVEDPCVNLWPDGIEKGEVELSYRVSETCEIIDASFTKSVPEGPFESMALCEVGRSYPVIPLNSERKVLSQKEYEQAQEEYKKKYPDKYNSRNIVVTTSNSDKVALTCYFNESWELTSQEINTGSNVVEVNKQYIQSLPIQKYEARFEQKF